MLVVSAYLLFTIYEADHEMRAQPSFYQDLGVPLTAAEREIKSRFRRLAATHHPDKAGAADSASLFIHLKLASDTLQDAAKRFAYERFGPDVVGWKDCVTVKDFVHRGLLAGTLPHYAVAASTMYLLGMFGYMEFAKFHRWLILATLCLFEVHAVTRPAFPLVVNVLNAVMTRLTPRAPYLPFQVIQLARKLAITLYIGLSQIGPLLAARTQARGRGAARGDDKALDQGLQRLEAVADQLKTETTRLVDM